MGLEPTFQKLRKIILESSGMDGDWVFPETKLNEIGDCEDWMAIEGAIELSFGIELPAWLTGNETVGQLADLCERKAGGDGEVDF